MPDQTYIIYTDGGARGNPGPAAIGVVVKGPGMEKKEYGQYIGETTNNVAEYRAVAFALHKLKQLIGSEKAKESSVKMYIDSELLVKQLNGEYKVKEATLQELFLEIWNLRLDFGSIAFSHIPRESNSAADRMVNWALDREENRLV
ncbi:MAG: ribonuclease HI family protein [Patescibacteria group bacterium]